MTIAKTIAQDMDVEPTFPIRRWVIRKKQFDETNHDDQIQSLEESFKVEYFLVVVDMAITSLHTRFEQLKTFENIFGFLYDSKKLKSLDDIELKKNCINFVTTFSNNDVSDVDLDAFFFQTKSIKSYFAKYFDVFDWNFKVC